MPISKMHHLDLAGGKFDKTTRADLDALFQNAQKPEHKNKPLLVHFHGGLVGQKYMEKAIEGENGLLGQFSQFGYPVFFLWQAGVFEVVKNNLREIVTEHIFDLLLKKLIDFIKKKIKGELIGEAVDLATKGITEGEVDHKIAANNAPFESYLEEISELSPREKREFRDALEADDELQREIVLISQNFEEPKEETGEKGLVVKVTTNKRTLMSPDLFEEGLRQPAAGDKGIFTVKKILEVALEVAVRVIGRYRDKTHHGLYPTVFEELCRMYYLKNVGKILWDTIKKDTADAFVGTGDIYGGTGFLEALKEHWEKGYRPEIFLFGHSAGAIFIHNLLKASDEWGLPEEIKFNLVFAAPALSVEKFAETIEGYGHRIKNIRIFNLSDELETKDDFIPIIYPYSLLYFLSGVLEGKPDKPLVGMQRYYSKNPPYALGKRPAIKTVIEYLEGTSGALIFSPARKTDGHKTGAQSHWDFNHEDPLLLESFRHIVENGY